MIVGLAVLGRGDAGVDTSSTPSPSTVSSISPAESLAEIEFGEAAVPTFVPDGWSIDPLISDGLLTWNFVDTAGGRTGGVRISGRIDSGPTDDVVEVAGIEWEVLESTSSYRARFEEAGVVVSAPGFAFDEIEPLLDGLRPGPIDAHPGGVFDASSAAVIATTSPGVLRATIVNERLCWAFSELGERRAIGCSLDPVDQAPPRGADVDDGVAVLMQFGIGTSIENQFRDTVIGVTSTDITAVEVEFTDGETVTIQTADPTGNLGVRMFVANKVIDRTDEAPSLVSISVPDPDEQPTPVTLAANGAAEAARDSIKAMLVEDGWTDIGGDHDVAGSATFGVELSDGTVVTGSVLFGATNPIGDTTITGSTVVSGREIISVGETSAFATCDQVGITISADTAETSLELLTQALEQLDCP